MLTVKLSNRNLALAGLVAALLTGAYYFGITGAMTLLGIAAFFFLPFFLILRKSGIEDDEKVFFAFFIGLGLFSAAVFYAGRVIPSFRASVAVAFVLLLLAPFAIKKYGGRKK